MPFLKFSGFDALEIQGKAETDVILFIDGDKGRVTIETAPLEEVDLSQLGIILTDMYSDGDEKIKRSISVLSTGRAAIPHLWIWWQYVSFNIMNT